VYVNDGKVVRVRPLVVEEKDFSPWTIKADGSKYIASEKFMLSPFVHAERTRLYSEARIRYPLRRVDFDLYR
jgi:trimethylamine-N-oxide reductase (cytochrome c)